MAHNPNTVLTEFEIISALMPEPLVDDAYKDAPNMLSLILRRVPELRAYALAMCRAHSTTYSDALAKVLLSLMVLVAREQHHAECDTTHELYTELALPRT